MKSVFYKQNLFALEEWAFLDLVSGQMYSALSCDLCHIQSYLTAVGSQIPYLALEWSK